MHAIVAICRYRSRRSREPRVALELALKTAPYDVSDLLYVCRRCTLKPNLVVLEVHAEAYATRYMLNYEVLSTQWVAAIGVEITYPVLSAVAWDEDGDALHGEPLELNSRRVVPSGELGLDVRGAMTRSGILHVCVSAFTTLGKDEDEEYRSRGDRGE